jgi:hypothetical protein
MLSLGWPPFPDTVCIACGTRPWSAPLRSAELSARYSVAVRINDRKLSRKASSIRFLFTLSFVYRHLLTSCPGHHGVAPHEQHRRSGSRRRGRFRRGIVAASLQRGQWQFTSGPRGFRLPGSTPPPASRRHPIHSLLLYRYHRGVQCDGRSADLGRYGASGQVLTESLTVLGIIAVQCRNSLPCGRGSVSGSACFRMLTEPRP